MVFIPSPGNLSYISKNWNKPGGGGRACWDLTDTFVCNQSGSFFSDTFAGSLFERGGGFPQISSVIN